MKSVILLSRDGIGGLKVTCKDCIHVKVCKISDTLGEAQSNAECCPHFADRSRFVELPCKRGELVYFIKARRVMADIVSKFTIDKHGVMLQRVNGYNLGYTDQLGKKIFLTEEEAEQALKLKERENNAE